jgi:hypothetical protein
MGRVDVDAMLSELTWPQLREWMAFYELSPWGAERGDLQAAIVASTIANVWRAKGRRYRVADFLPTFGARAQTQEEMAAVLTMAAQAARRAKNGRSR